MPKAQKLIQLRAFRGIDYTTADPDQSLQDAAGGYNADTFRQPGAMTTTRGPLQFATLPSAPTFGGLVRYGNPSLVGGAADTEYVVSTAGGMMRYSSASGLTTTITNGVAFNSGFQFGNSIYTNGGQRIMLTTSGSTVTANAYSWYYRNQVNVSTTPLVNITGAGAAGPFVSGTLYCYATTTLTTFADGSTQESGVTYIFTFPLGEYFAITAAANYTTINLTTTAAASYIVWYGTNADGSTWTTNLYRLSSTQPNWYYVGNANAGSVGSATTGTFADTNSDATIAANAQIQTDLYPNPASAAFNAGVTNYGPVFHHKERAWQFALFANTISTNSLTQCQLWFSDAGLPYQFHSAQVLLVGSDSDNDAANPTNTAVSYLGTATDHPMGGLSLSSVAILFKKRSTWIVYGDDPSTFVPRKMWDLGCVGPAAFSVCEDVFCWVSESGAYMSDGSTKTYIGEPMRLAWAEYADYILNAAICWYGNRTWFVKIGVTVYRYYLPKGVWLPPQTTGAGQIAAVASTISDIGPNNQQGDPFNAMVVATSSTLSYWEGADGAASGIGNAEWITPISDSGEPGVEKEYQWIVVNGPIQPGAVLQVVVESQGYGGTRQATAKFDLGLGPTLVSECGDVNGALTGFMAQMTITLTPPAGSTTYSTLYSVELQGSIQHEIVASPQGVS